MPTILRAKCIVVGDSTVGKSALTQVFHSDGTHYPKNYTLTAGVELLVKAVNIPDSNDCVELYIYDSAGKEIFYEIVQKHWDHPSVVMLVYDVTSETSFDSCAKWLERVRSQKPEMQFPGVLVANKIDLDQRRVISPKAGKDFAQSNGLEYFEVSAKEMQQVEAPFYFLANEFHKMYKERLEQFKTLA
ncbi:intraflagellar transport protein 27 homolog [Lingula anatina]|uniref:Intraflagellar transport protein 27 homolog n=1 Tax=Lingula anatina TaxID=7574 RepID=A0A1S3HED6_LINAN|nr:intraflagellar transport protein 27 homolog [Lingula anatina]|eukprot:XP_013384370.1 intraflagellar transport protein 27 homolog [Lingula anatina]